MSQVERDFLKAAADAVNAEAARSPEIGIPVDPDVADFMGTFEEKAIIDLDEGE